MSETRRIKGFLQRMVQQIILDTGDTTLHTDRFESVAEGASHRFHVNVKFVKFHAGDPARVTFQIYPPEVHYSAQDVYSIQVSAPWPAWRQRNPSLFANLEGGW